MVQKAINMSDLHLLNELSYILECIASEYTGEAKSAIEDVKSQIDTDTYPLQTSLVTTLDYVHSLLQEPNVTRAAKTLTPVIRNLWNDVIG